MSVASRGGSHGGRGFRYQYAVAAWLTAASWASTFSWGMVIPEGGDDVELDGAGIAFAQVKSRRAHLGSFPASEVAGFVKDLWNRGQTAVAAPERLILVLERDVRDEVLTPFTFEPLPASVLDKLSGDARSASLAGKTRIVIAPSPQEQAVSIIEAQSKATPLAALVCYGELLSRIGALSDANGMKSPGFYDGLSRSDVDSLITGMLGSLDQGALEEAIATGLCEPVDFITPLNDPNFYLGVDVEPGHLAAGLVAERPAARERVAEALEARGNALVVGPSGAGKSALMWETARTLRHSVRWFRVRRLTAEDVPVLRRLALTFRANAASPIGFVLDDVGRLGPEAWSQLARETPAQSGVVLLASVREEDVFVLTERGRASEIRPHPDDELAERMWQALRDAGQTKWDGWLEPWRQSKKLLLEYAFILTQGERMDAVLQQQVAVRVADATRGGEMAVLRVSACAGAAGARLNVKRLGKVLNLAEASMAHALQRLIAEHLITEVEPGVIGGLHQVRSEGLMRAALATPPPTYAELLARAMRSSPGSDLERLISDALLRREASLEDVYAAAKARLSDTKDAGEFAAILRGLANAYIASRVSTWLELPEVKAIPRTQVTTAARFGVAREFLDALPAAQTIMKAAKALAKLMGEGADPRDAFVSNLPDDVLGALVGGPISFKDLERLCAAFIGGKLPSALRSALEGHAIDVATADLKELQKLLGTVAQVDREIATKWINADAEQVLLKRVAAEWPWAGEAVVREEDGKIVIALDYWYVAQSRQPNVNDDVVALCLAMLSLIPRADIAASRALAVNGMVAGFAHLPMAEKRIPRENLPAEALPEWNRRWIAAIGDRVASDSYSGYLKEAIAILDALTPSLADVMDRILRGKGLSQVQADRVNGLLDRVERLTPPRATIADVAGTGDDRANREVTEFQHVFHCCCAEIVLRFRQLPDRAGADIAWLDDILKMIDGVAEREPWIVVSLNEPPANLAVLRGHVERIRLITGEAAARNQAPTQTWTKVGVSAKTGNALRLVATKAQASTTKRFEAREAELTAIAAQAMPNARVFVRPYPDGILPWPPVQVLALIDVDDVEGAVIGLAEAQIALRAAIEPHVRLTLIPVVSGLAILRFALSGQDTLLPLPGHSAEWAASVGAKMAEHPATDAFDRASTSAGELASLDKLGLGTPVRPQVEQDVRAAATEEYERELANLTAAVAPLQQEIAQDAIAIIRGVRDGKLDLAGGAQSQIMGQESKDAAIVGMTLILVLQAELNAASGPPP